MWDGRARGFEASQAFAEPPFRLAARTKPALHLWAALCRFDRFDKEYHLRIRNSDCLKMADRNVIKEFEDTHTLIITSEEGVTQKIDKSVVRLEARLGRLTEKIARRTSTPLQGVDARVAAWQEHRNQHGHRRDADLTAMRELSMQLGRLWEVKE